MPSDRAFSGASRRWWGVLAMVALVAACRASEPPVPAQGADARTARPSSTAAAPDPRAAQPRIVALGDSLTAGYGLEPGDAYPAQLQRFIDVAGLGYSVVNMGVSGDTSAGGLSRLDWALEGDVRILIVALGGNDGLRGLSPADLERNLGTIIDRARQRDIKVLLCGMEAPPNLGPAFTRDFRAVYPRLAREKGVELLPFLLEGVAGVASLNQADGIHPTAEGARRVADLVWARLRPMLQPSVTP